MAKENSIPPRFAAVASKAVLKTAPARNLFRRRVYVLLRRQLPSFVRGTLVSVSAKKNIASLSFGALQTELYSLLIKAKLLKSLTRTS